ncbi:MAG TPA: hypothetical protein PKE29_18065 [Phycisphaerales bacterium]|nr:hypothetical protein [Phycisphaerales bacterium]
MAINVNPPAFPVPSEHDTIGLTQRDYVAIWAMQAIISRGPTNPSDAALGAYQFADAMIAQSQTLPSSAKPSGPEEAV